MTEQVLQALRRHTNHRGLTIVHEASLLKELSVSAEDLRAALKQLEERRLVEILAPLPFLVLKWSGIQQIPAENGPKPGPSGASRYSFHSLINRLIKA